jgi:hypothetical protein
MRETAIRNGTVSMWRRAWKIYSTFVVTGAIIGTVSYGVLTLAVQSSFLSFIAITLPLILGFCIVVSLPLAGIALFVFTLLEKRFGPRPTSWWRFSGAVIGIALVATALLCVLSVGALSNTAGRVFWLTFLVAGAVAGGRAGALLNTNLEET